MNPLFSNLTGFVQASRVPNLIIIAVTQVLVAYALLGREFTEILNVSFGGLIISTLMIAAAGYIINDYYDQKIDMINRPERVIVGVKLKRRLAMAAHTLLNFSAIFIGWKIDPVIGMIHIFSAFCLWIYSNQLRRMPFFGNLIIALLTGLTFVIVSIFYRETSNLVLIYAFFAFFVTFIREIIKDIEDVKGEAAFGCTTIPIIWGIRGAKILIYMLSLIGTVLLIYFLLNEANIYVIIYFALLSPVFLWFIISIVRADTQSNFRFLHQVSNWLIISGIFSMLFLHESL